MRSQLLLILAISLLSCAFAPRAHAWAERGHHLIARVAVRALMERSGKEASLRTVFWSKDHLLGHLANIPDTRWRNIGREVESANAPTHYIDLEYLSMTPDELATLPRTTTEAAARIKELCAKQMYGYVCPGASHAGSAPWRIGQLFSLMVAGLRKGNKDGIDEALLYGGLMAHFVGDLANPHHTTRDYDGWERGQGGAHGYFEGEVVGAFDLGLDAEVEREALSRKHGDRVLASLGDKAQDPLEAALALAVDSFGKLDTLYALDKKIAVTKASSEEKGMRLKAERKPAAEVAGQFRPLVVERLATGADVLAQLWLAAWTKAGKPKMTEYQSYRYDLAPEFVTPDHSP